MNPLLKSDHVRSDPADPLADAQRTNARRRWTMAGLVAGAAALAAAAWQGQARAQGASLGSHRWQGPIDEATMGRRIDAIVAWALADIEAAPEQRERIAAIAKAAAIDLAPLRARHRGARRESLALFAAPTIDRARFEALRAEQVQLGDAASRRVVQALLDAADVLTAEQRAQLVRSWRLRRQRRRG
jgi:Spy/CpxP family protein refolding chaperone